jgi:hypothetical protein
MNISKKIENEVGVEIINEEINDKDDVNKKRRV